MPEDDSQELGSGEEEEWGLKDEAGGERVVPRKLDRRELIRRKMYRLRNRPMGFLLKEALKSLCGANQWAYAVFWKIGCQNPKLLIWEECYYEPTACSVPRRISGIDGSFEEWEECWVSPEIHSSQLWVQEGDKVHSLINKMTVNNQVNVVGEGIVGRAAFTGNYQWVLLNNYISNAHPPEVLNEVLQQFSAGMQTVAVIPALPHGVVQLGSPLAIMENMGFVNDVKSLILQLGCVPGALLSDNYATKESTEIIGEPVPLGVPIYMDPSGNFKVMNSVPSVSDSRRQLSNSSQPPRLGSQLSHSLIRQIQGNSQATTPTFQTSNLTQTLAKSNYDHCQPMVAPVLELNLPSRAQLMNGVVGAEVIPSKPDAWLNQQASSCNTRRKFDHQFPIGLTDESYSSIRLMEQQILPGAGVGDHFNNTSASCSSIASQPRMKGHLIFNSHKSSISMPLVGKSELPNGVSSQFKPMSIPCSVLNPQKLADIDLSCAHLSGPGNELQNADLAQQELVPLSSPADQFGRHTLSRGSYHRVHNTDVKHNPIDMTQRKHGIEKDLFQALDIPLTHTGVYVSSGEHIAGVHDSEKDDNGSRSSRHKNDNNEAAGARLPSGDDLFDILGVDFKKKILNSSRNNVVTNGLDANLHNLGEETSTFTNMLGAGSDIYSVSEGMLTTGICSGTGADHLLDAVVSRVHSAAKQSSDDNMSCRTTLTNISSSSVPTSSPTYGQVGVSDKVQGELFSLPKSLSKAGTVGSGSFISGCSKDDSENCLQTNSIYGSQISSWAEQGHNVRRDSSVSTAYSKRPDEISKSNRKRLKPGENPRPRPKDRQMIQDRVKELREIVPNGAKCSIDGLLERTIKHMLFLQSVTKHADKLKQTGESKIITKEDGLVIKDNFEGGATWAFEVGSQSLVCPIIVEDLNPPRQLLVEMLCEERGFFLEIADLIRGLGLTILKGVMEARNDKVWARFAVEANKDVTRMEIFMSLVRLLEQTVEGTASSANAIDNDNMMVHHSFPQSASIPATGRHSNLL